MIDDLLPAALLARLDRDGGFTVEARTGAPVERGIAVCLQPSGSWTFRRAALRPASESGSPVAPSAAMHRAPAGVRRGRGRRGRR